MQFKLLHFSPKLNKKIIIPSSVKKFQKKQKKSKLDKNKVYFFSCSTNKFFFKFQ